MTRKERIAEAQAKLEYFVKLYTFQPEKRRNLKKTVLGWEAATDLQAEFRAAMLYIIRTLDDAHPDGVEKGR